MKFCQSHWTALREAIESRGLGHLIAANGREAAARVADELSGQADITNYDPLMHAHNMLGEHAMGFLGVVQAVQGDCPVCEMLKTYPAIPEGHRYASNEEYFISGPADAALDFCRHHGIDMPAAPPGAPTL